MFTLITDSRFGPLMTQVTGLSEQGRANACRQAIAAHRQALVDSGQLDELAARRESILVAKVRYAAPKVAVGTVAA